ncbi:beta strand repeat-containing protein [Erythrobacter sp. MTPC3]|uniref:beta strand repeat-containing protein n=1 Tax=Erythrobacter sp. MTPC3 TaxID=3056564 RepID=UPI0036F372FF
MIGNSGAQKNFVAAKSDEGLAKNDFRWSVMAMLRGGRVTKLKGQTGSYSPQLGEFAEITQPSIWAALSTGALARQALMVGAAPAAILLGTAPAAAQDDCVEGPPGEFVCEDNGAAATVTQNVNGTVDIEDGFEVDTSAGAGDAMSVTGTDITVSQISGTSTLLGFDNGLRVISGGGTVVIDTAGPITGLNSNGLLARNYGGTSLSITATDVSGGTNGIQGRNYGTGALSITATGAVNGVGNDGIVARNFGTNLVIDTASTSGDRNGINARNYGSGSLQVTASGAINGRSNDGITITNYGDGGTDIDVADVSGGRNGINARDYGAGSLSISSSGTVTAGSDDAIFARNFNGTDLSIDAVNANGGRGGINAINFGTGTLTVTSTGDVSGAAANGTYVRNYGTDLTVTANNNSGDESGIRALQFGSGSLTITSSGTANGNDDDGIFAYNAAGSANLTITAADSYGGRVGINARNRGSGALSITSTGAATGAGSDGIVARNYTGSTDLSVTAVDSSGERFGINVRSDGTGAMAITTTGAVSGNTADGIYAVNSAAASSLSITSSGTVTGANDGIDARNSGSGLLSIVTADITGTNGDGISATSSGSGISIDSSAGTVQGRFYGIDASNNGTGSLAITAADTSASAGRAIRALNAATGSDLTIVTDAGTVTGSTAGIYAQNDGTGILSITTADVTAGSSFGILVLNAGTDVVVDTSAGTVTSVDTGIAANNSGTGSITVVSGDVGSTSAAGVFANNSAAGTDISVDTTDGAVIAETSGVLALNAGSGSTTVLTGDVTSLTGTAAVEVASSGTDQLIDTSAGVITAAQTGILATHTGSGNMTVVSADIFATTGAGVYASNSGADLSIDTAAGAIVSEDEGIAALQSGTGDLVIVTGDVTSNTSNAVYALTDTASANLSIDTSAGSLIASNSAVAVSHYGAGSASITTADVESTGTSAAISALADGTDLTINSSAGSVTSNGLGILAQNDGTGALTITTSDVDSADDGGIVAVNYGTDLAIDSSDGSVTSSGVAIQATNYGTGTLAIDAGNVSSSGASGISAFNLYGTDLTIDSASGSVSGTGGIYATNAGSGALDITVANVTGTSSSALTAFNNGTDLIIDSTAGSLAGSAYGLRTFNYGTGALSVTTGDVTGEGNTALFAVGNSAGTDVSVDTSGGAVTGADIGLDVRNYGSGGLMIVSADVTGTDYGGILALLGSSYAPSGTDIDIDTAAGSVSGNTYGILASSFGSGSVTVTTADVTGVDGDAIMVTNSASGDSITIDTSAGAIESSDNAIVSQNLGTGSTSIITADVTAADGDAVVATNAGTDLSIDTAAGAISGSAGGIVAENTGTGSTTITAGDVTGQSGAGISVTNGFDASGLSIINSGVVSGQTVGILIDNDGTVSSTIENNGTITSVTGELIRAAGSGVSITNNGEMAGFVSLSEGDDEFTNNAAFLVEGDSVFGLGSDILTNNSVLTVSSLGPVSLLGLESFANAGTINLADGAVGNNLTIGGDFTGTGDSALLLDVSLETSTADTLVIAGAASGSTILGFNPLGTSVNRLIDDILIVDAGSGSIDGAFSLDGGQQAIGLLLFDLVFDAANNDYLLTTAPSQAVFQISNIPEGIRNLWSPSADGWSDYMETRRTGSREQDGSIGGGGDQRTEAWFTGFGSTMDRDRAVTTVVNFVSSDFAVDYSQDAFGFQAGIDFGNDVFRYGLTGGFMTSQQNFSGTSDRIDYEVVNIGAYFAIDAGAFYANALVKYDDVSGDLLSPSGQIATEIDGSTIGGRAEIGVLIGARDGLFLEPNASLSYVSSDVSDFSAPQGDFVFDEGESALGKVGARVGTGFDMGSRSGTIHLGARYVHEFEGEDGVSFISGTRSFDFNNGDFDDYVELDAGVTIGDETDAVSASFLGHVITGDDVDGFGASVNLRFRF